MKINTSSIIQLQELEYTLSHCTIHTSDKGQRRRLMLLIKHWVNYRRKEKWWTQAQFENLLAIRLEKSDKRQIVVYWCSLWCRMAHTGRCTTDMVERSSLTISFIKSHTHLGNQTPVVSDARTTEGNSLGLFHDNPKKLAWADGRTGRWNSYAAGLREI